MTGSVRLRRCTEVEPILARLRGYRDIDFDITVAESLGSRAEALKAYRQALVMLEKLVARCPGVPEYRLELAEVHHNLGHFYAETGQIDQALRGYEAGRAIRDQLLRDRPDDPRLLRRKQSPTAPHPKPSPRSS